jgi:hypothetical protein
VFKLLVTFSFSFFIGHIKPLSGIRHVKYQVHTYSACIYTLNINIITVDIFVKLLVDIVNIIYYYTPIINTISGRYLIPHPILLQIFTILHNITHVRFPTLLSINPL